MLPRQQLGRYEILEKIGEGGLSTVYKAFDTILQRVVALKILKVVDAVLAHRFFREARAQAGVEHENICPIYDFGEIDGIPYIAMHYIQGRSLQEAAPELTLEKKLYLIKCIALALHKAHHKGLIHRDLKPSNIMIELNEEGKEIPKIIDFGLAKETSQADSTMPGMIIGTLGYMAPEQIEGRTQEIDRRTDVYGLGAILYTLITGSAPFQGETFEAMRAAMEKDPIPLRKICRNIPADVETITLKCLEKEPRHRYASAKELAEDIDRFLRDEPISAKRSSAAYRIWKKIKKHPAVTALAGAAAVVIIFLIAFLLLFRHEARVRQNYALEFEQQIKYIEDMLWYAYSLPPHDIRPELATVQERLDQIEKKISKLGKLAYGPGYYALGRGHLYLNHLEEAKNFLELAWDRYHYRMPNVAFYLCQALTMIYEKEWDRGEKISDVEVRKKYLAELQAYYEPRIKNLLQLAQKAELEIEGYLEALLAARNGKYDEAIRAIARLKENFPWFYDAFELEADIYRQLGISARERGERRQAWEDFRKAEKILDELCRNNESDPNVYKALAQVEIDLLELLIHQSGEKTEEPFAKIVQALTTALRINPDDAESFNLFAYACWKQAQWQMYCGDSPEQLLRQSIYWAEKAIAVRPDDFLSYYHRATSLLELGAYYNSIGKDPLPVLKEAIHDFEKTLQLNPSHMVSYNNLALCYWNWGQFCNLRHEDPRPYLMRGVEIIEKCLNSLPPFSAIYHTLANIYLEKAYYERGAYLDADSSIQKAQQALMQAVGLNPNNVLFYNNLAETWKLTAAAAADRNSPPDSAWAKAKQCIQKAIVINPNFLWTYVTAFNIALDQAKSAMIARKNPSPYLREAKQYLDYIRPLKAQSVMELKALYFLMQAQWFKNTHRPFVSAAQAGIEFINNLDASNLSADLFAIRGLLYRLLAQETRNDSLLWKSRKDLELAFAGDEKRKNQYRIFLE